MCAASLNAGNAVPPGRQGAQVRLRALQSDIIDLILERELEPGDPLPTENELAAVLGIGRNTLREALKVLQAVGVIEIRHGFGMFVAAANFAALIDGLGFRTRLSLRHGGQEARELIEVRRLLETGLLGAAMAATTAEQLAGLEAAVLRMEELARSGGHFVQADADFHRKLFEPLGNELLLGLVGAFQAVSSRIQPGRGGSGDIGPAADAALYRSIYEAVAAGDAVLAAERLGSHFDGMRRRVAVAVGE